MRGPSINGTPVEVFLSESGRPGTTPTDRLHPVRTHPGRNGPTVHPFPENRGSVGNPRVRTWCPPADTEVTGTTDTPYRSRRKVTNLCHIP